MGRRRRKTIRVSKKRLPKVYICPICGKEAIKINLDVDNTYATVQCAGCGLSNKLPIKPTFEEIDVYCQFTDNFYSDTEL